MTTKTKGLAIVDLLNGRAYIESGTGFFTLKAEDSGPRDAKGTSYGMFMQPADNELVERDSGDYPFTELHAFLKKCQANGDALMLFVSSCDKDISLETRQEVVAELESKFADQTVFEFIRERLLKKQLPASANLEAFGETGKIGQLMAAVREKWGMLKKASEE